MKHYLERALLAAIQNKNIKNVEVFFNQFAETSGTSLDVVDNDGNNYIHIALQTNNPAIISKVFDLFKKSINLFFQKNKSLQSPLDLALKNKNIPAVMSLMSFLESKEADAYRQEETSKLENFLRNDKEFSKTFVLSLKEQAPHWIETDSKLLPFALFQMRILPAKDVTEIVNPAADKVFDLSEENRIALLFSGLSLELFCNKTQTVYDFFFSRKLDAVVFIERLLAKLDMNDEFAVASVSIILKRLRKKNKDLLKIIEAELRRSFVKDKQGLRKLLMLKFTDNDFLDEVPLELNLSIKDPVLNFVPEYKTRLQDVQKEYGKNEVASPSDNTVSVFEQLALNEAQAQKLVLFLEQLNIFAEEMEKFLEHIRKNYTGITWLYVRRLLTMSLVAFFMGNLVAQGFYVSIVTSGDNAVISLTEMFIAVVGAVIGFMVLSMDLGSIFCGFDFGYLVTAQLPCYCRPEDSIYVRSNLGCDVLTVSQKNTLDNFIENLKELKKNLQDIDVALANKLGLFINELEHIRDSNQSIKIMHDKLKELLADKGIMAGIAKVLNIDHFDLSDQEDKVMWQFFKQPRQEVRIEVQKVDLSDDKSDEKRWLLDKR